MKEKEHHTIQSKQQSSSPGFFQKQTAAPFFPPTSKQAPSAVNTPAPRIQLLPIGGPALAATAATQSSSLPAAVVQRWQAEVTANNLLGAVQVVANEMVRRGEIDTSIYRVQQSSSGSTTCLAPNPQLFVIDSSVNGANTSQCTCAIPVTGSIKLANPRVHIHPDLVQFTRLGSTNPQTNATVLHSTLLHEFRHVRQMYEACNTPGTVISSGLCTDCNNPEEMDAYLAQIEAGYNNSEIMNAWVRVYVNWNYISVAQQNIFNSRKRSAEQKVNRIFPGVPWSINAGVRNYEAWCQSLPGNGSPGTCNSFLTNTSATIVGTGAGTTP